MAEGWFATAIGFPVTPFSPDLELNLTGLRQIAERMVVGGITTLTCAAGTGEFYSLAPEECEAVYATTVEAADRRAQVIAGVGFGVAVGTRLARYAEATGCAGVLIMPPYLTAGNESGWLDYYQRIAASTSLPCAIYLRDHVRISARALEELCVQAPNLVALKDGTGNIRGFQEYRRALGDRLIWLGGVGDDWAPSYFAAGAQGFTSSVANFDPALALELFHLCNDGKLVEARTLVDAKIRAFFGLRLRGYDVALTKAACELVGLPAGPVRPPGVNLTPSDRAEFIQTMQSAGLLAGVAGPI